MFWCTADVGWITGHSYITYGPLLAGATQVMFEGVAHLPRIRKVLAGGGQAPGERVLHAPTAIRSLMACGLDHVLLRPAFAEVLGTVGEPINEEAWHWYKTHIGKDRCPVVDTWWQTETGGI